MAQLKTQIANEKGDFELTKASKNGDTVNSNPNNIVIVKNDSKETKNITVSLNKEAVKLFGSKDSSDISVNIDAGCMKTIKISKLYVKNGFSTINCKDVAGLSLAVIC